MEQQTVENNLQSVIADFAKNNIIALPYQVGRHKLSVAVDTGATVNIISEHSFRELRRSLRGGRCRHLPNGMDVVEVTRYNLEILWKVLLTVWPSRKVSAFRSCFYVTNKLALSVDALLGLNTMRELRMLISPDTNYVIYKGKPLKGMSNSSPLAFLDSPLTGEQSVSPIVVKERLGGEEGYWPTVLAKVEGTQETPDRAAKKITVRVDKAQVCSDVCIDGAPDICRIAVE